MYSHITVIPLDSVVIVDGSPLTMPCNAPADMHALQWHNGSGHIEYNDGKPNRPLGLEDYIAAVHPFAAAWEEENNRRIEEANRQPTLAEQQKVFTDAIQAHLDAFARTRGYDSIHTAASYDGDPDPLFGHEGAYAKKIRSATWRKGYEILNAVLCGSRSMPTIKEVMNELPKPEWPEV